LQRLCSVRLPISSLGHWFWGILVFWIHAYSGYHKSFVWCIASKDFLPFCGWPLQFRDHFFLFLCRSLLILCSPICWSFLLVAVAPLIKVPLVNITTLRTNWLAHELWRDTVKPYQTTQDLVILTFVPWLFYGFQLVMCAYAKRSSKS
jgi:hypothetical protein